MFTVFRFSFPLGPTVRPLVLIRDRAKTTLDGLILACYSILKMGVTITMMRTTTTTVRTTLIVLTMYSPHRCETKRICSLILPIVQEDSSGITSFFYFSPHLDSRRNTSFFALKANCHSASNLFLKLCSSIRHCWESVMFFSRLRL